MAYFLGKGEKPVRNRPQYESNEFSRTDKHLQVPVRKIHNQIIQQGHHSEVSHHFPESKTRNQGMLPVNGAPDVVLGKKKNRPDYQRKEHMRSVSCPFLESHGSYGFKGFPELDDTSHIPASL